MTETETTVNKTETETLETETDKWTETFKALVSQVSVQAKRPRPRGIAWAYFGTGLGGVASLVANVAHSFIKPENAPQGWHPQTGAVVAAALYPVFLFVALEIFIKIEWPSKWWMWCIRVASLMPVALVAAVVSFQHMSSLLDSYGEHWVVCLVGPLAVDGLMVMAAAATAVAKWTKQTQVSVPMVQVSKPKRQVKTETRAVETARPVPETARPTIETARPTVETETRKVSAAVSLPAPRVETTKTVEVSSLPARSQSRAEQIETIKVAVPNWREIGGEVSNATLTEVTGITGKQTLTNLRKILREEAAGQPVSELVSAI